MRPFQIALLLSLAACDSKMILPNETDPLTPMNDTAPLSPGVRPVTIGESGSNFAACATRGTVVDLGSDTQPLRRAPFADAETAGTVVAGQRLFVCTRSIDQRWLGVVVVPIDAPNNGCGVSVPVESKRDYNGSCGVGWLRSAHVRLVGR